MNTHPKTFHRFSPDSLREKRMIFEVGGGGEVQQNQPDIIEQVPENIADILTEDMGKRLSNDKLHEAVDRINDESQNMFAMIAIAENLPAFENGISQRAHPLFPYTLDPYQENGVPRLRLTLNISEMSRRYLDGRNVSEQDTNLLRLDMENVTDDQQVAMLTASGIITEDRAREIVRNVDIAREATQLTQRHANLRPGQELHRIDFNSLQATLMWRFGVDYHQDPNKLKQANAMLSEWNLHVDGSGNIAFQSATPPPGPTPAPSPAPTAAPAPAPTSPSTGPEINTAQDLLDNAASLSNAELNAEAVQKLVAGLNETQRNELSDSVQNRNPPNILFKVEENAGVFSLVPDIQGSGAFFYDDPEGFARELRAIDVEESEIQTALTFTGATEEQQKTILAAAPAAPSTGPEINTARDLLDNASTLSNAQLTTEAMQKLVAGLNEAQRNELNDSVQNRNPPNILFKVEEANGQYALVPDIQGSGAFFYDDPEGFARELRAIDVEEDDIREALTFTGATEEQQKKILAAASTAPDPAPETEPRSDAELKRLMDLLILQLKNEETDADTASAWMKEPKQQVDLQPKLNESSFRGPIAREVRTKLDTTNLVGLQLKKDLNGQWEIAPQEFDFIKIFFAFLKKLGIFNMAKDGRDAISMSPEQRANELKRTRQDIAKVKGEIATQNERIRKSPNDPLLQEGLRELQQRLQTLQNREQTFVRASQFPNTDEGRRQFAQEVTRQMGERIRQVRDFVQRTARGTEFEGMGFDMRLESSSDIRVTFTHQDQNITKRMVNAIQAQNPNIRVQSGSYTVRGRVRYAVQVLGSLQDTQSVMEAIGGLVGGAQLVAPPAPGGAPVAPAPAAENPAESVPEDLSKGIGGRATALVTAREARQKGAPGADENYAKALKALTGEIEDSRLDTNWEFSIDAVNTLLEGQNLRAEINADNNVQINDLNAAPIPAPADDEPAVEPTDEEQEIYDAFNLPEQPEGEVM